MKMSVDIPPGLKSLHATKRLWKTILYAYVLIMIMIPLIHAIVPWKSTMHKRLSATSTSAFMDSKRVHSARHCSQRCSQKNGCKAFNVIRVEQCDDSSPKFECEMFSSVDPAMIEDDDASVLWELNYCHGHLCKIGGQCNIQGEGYKCACTDGYTGQYCETEINECASDPCQNGGTCTDALNHFTCDCLAGYEGPHCEIDINECASDPCQNGGTCRDELNKYMCECPTGFYGLNCQTNKIRLVNGANEHEGRVEIFHDGAWGRVCDAGFYQEEATVICKSLGYQSGTYHRKAHFGEGSGQLCHLNCSGNEASLTKCSIQCQVYTGGHTPGTGVTCS